VTSVHLTNAYHDTSGGIRTFYRALLAAAPRHRHRVCLIVPGVTEGVEDVNAFARIYFVRAIESTAKVLVVGTSTFEMRYRYLSINGHAVESPSHGPDPRVCAAPPPRAE
jgi:hypothetical protein